VQILNFTASQIMFRVRDAVKFGASGVCPKCNSGPPLCGVLLSGSRGYETMSAFEEHKEELEKFEQMFGRERGRLAVSLDRLTNGGDGPMGRMDDSVVRQVHQFSAQGIHDLLHGAAPQVGAANAPGKKRVAGKELRGAQLNLLGLAGGSNFL